MLSDFGAYLWAVIWNWYALMAVGAWGILTAIEKLWRTVPKRVFQIFLVFLALLAPYGAWKEQRDIANEVGAPLLVVVDDPRFVPLDPRAKAITGGSIAELKSILRNKGGRSARGFTSTVRIIDQRFSKPIQSSESSMADEIPPDGQIVLNTQIKAIDNNADPFFMVIATQFQDPRTEKLFRHCFFRKWIGARDGVFLANTMHCTRQEAELVLVNVPELRRFCELPS